MTTYVKAPDSIINVVDGNGKARQVTQRAYDVVYKSQGYKLAEAKSVESVDPVDYFTLTADELEGIKNDDLKSFLDKESIQYKSNATKDELIALITGE
ncbi:hypothetical protein JNUCC23_01955 [Peribacillus sp. JNUCC 23]